MFSQEIFQVPNLTMITNGTVLVSDESGKQSYPVLEIMLQPGEDSDAQHLKLSWKAILQTPTKLVIQLFFEDAI